MTDNMKMMGRYLLAIAISYAVGRGWVPSAAGAPVTNFLIELGGLLAAYTPAIYAAWKIDNAPKT